LQFSDRQLQISDKVDVGVGAEIFNFPLNFPKRGIICYKLLSYSVPYARGRGTKTPPQ